MFRLKVREVAQAKGMSMGKLSRVADISYKTVKRIYVNPKHDVSLYTLERIACALDVNLSDLIDHLPDDQPLRK